MVFKNYFMKEVKEVHGRGDEGIFGEEITGFNVQRGSGEAEARNEVKLSATERGKQESDP
jgi:hypothetical protein